MWIVWEMMASARVEEGYVLRQDVWGRALRLDLKLPARRPVQEGRYNIIEINA